MTSLRSALQGIFVFFTLLIAVLIWKGAIIFSLTQMQLLVKILLPAYLVIAGIMMGIFLHTIFAHVSYHHIDEMSHQDRMIIEKDISSGMMLGLMIGAVLAFLYISKIS